MKRFIALVVTISLVLGIAPVFSESQNPNTRKIGIAWRKDTDSEFYTNVVCAVKEAGGEPVLLNQVMSADLEYDSDGKLIQGVDEIGALDVDAGRVIRENSWHGSNVEEVIGDIDTVIFTGGEDISSSLFLVQETWHGIEVEIDYNAERDVSDYLTMSYCLDNDLNVIGFCRGMQMLSVISGAEMIQDIPTYYESHGVEYHFGHRNNKITPDSYRDYAPHSVIIDANSIVFDVFETENLEGCPSWHHQAVKSVENTPLKVSAYIELDGISIIEAVERIDKSFAIGLQFHPEAAIVKHLDGFTNANDFMDYDTAIELFRIIVNPEMLELNFGEAA